MTPREWANALRNRTGSLMWRVETRLGGVRDRTTVLRRRGWTRRGNRPTRTGPGRESRQRAPGPWLAPALAAESLDRRPTAAAAHRAPPRDAPGTANSPPANDCLHR